MQQTSVRVIKRTDHARAAILHAGNLRSDDCCITLRGEDLGHGKQNRHGISVIQRVRLVLLKPDCSRHILAVKSSEGIRLILDNDRAAIRKVLEGPLCERLAVGADKQDTAAGRFHALIGNRCLQEFPTADLEQRKIKFRICTADSAVRSVVLRRIIVLSRLLHLKCYRLLLRRTGDVDGEFRAFARKELADLRRAHTVRGERKTANCAVAGIGNSERKRKRSARDECIAVKADIGKLQVTHGQDLRPDKVLRVVYLILRDCHSRVHAESIGPAVQRSGV